MNKKIVVSILALLFVGLFQLASQDQLPQKAPKAIRWEQIPAHTDIPTLIRVLSVGAAMPFAFRQTKENQLVDEYQTLYPLWSRISRMNEPVRIVQIGDSHIRGHVFPYEVRKKLEQSFGEEAVAPIPVTYQTSGLAVETGKPGIVYHCVGVNGATCESFMQPERLEEIAHLQPDLIICSFGTNEAHAPRYQRGEHLTALTQLYDWFRLHCPTAVFLLTTPPGAYIYRGRSTRMPNPRTEEVVQTLLDFARTHHWAYWDLYHIVGGSSQACRNWLSGGYYQRDQIHFTHEGYQLQGSLLHEALIKAFNRYVAIQLDK